MSDVGCGKPDLLLRNHEDRLVLGRRGARRRRCPGGGVWARSWRCRPTRTSRGWSPIRLRPRRPIGPCATFNAFLTRLRATAEPRESLLLHHDGLERAEATFRNTAGVPAEVQIEMHAPFFAVDPEAIYALYVDLPTLERGLALFQQNCSGCHGPYGRGNGAATREWYAGNYPRNFWYGKYKSRSTAYGRVPEDADLFRTLTRGMYGSSMPSFRHLSEADRWSPGPVHQDPGQLRRRV